MGIGIHFHLASADIMSPTIKSAEKKLAISSLSAAIVEGLLTAYMYVHNYSKLVHWMKSAELDGGIYK